MKLTDKISCIISKTTSPHLNTAIEDWLLHNRGAAEHILFIWQNSPCVIIGRHQNPWTECPVEYLKENNVELVRRTSGGGAVYQDIGNLNFSFISTKEEYNTDKTFNIIIDALKILKINAEKKGRNDIVVDGKKISGNAFKQKKESCFHHGTILFNVDLEQLTRCLTPSQKKLESKGIISVRSRVLNLQEKDSELTVDKIIDAIIHQYFATHNIEEKRTHISEAEALAILDIKQVIEKLQDHTWIYGETPYFTHGLEYKFDWGVVDVHLEVNKGNVMKATIFSDALDVKLIEELETALHVKYDSRVIIESLNICSKKNKAHSNKIIEFGEWVIGEINR